LAIVNAFSRAASRRANPQHRRIGALGRFRWWMYVSITGRAGVYVLLYQPTWLI